MKWNAANDSRMRDEHRSDRGSGSLSSSLECLCAGGQIDGAIFPFVGLSLQRPCPTVHDPDRANAGYDYRYVTYVADRITVPMYVPLGWTVADVTRWLMVAFNPIPSPRLPPLVIGDDLWADTMAAADIDAIDLA